MTARYRQGTRSYLIDLRLTTQQIQSFYAGRVSRVSAQDHRGVRIEFPLHALRPHIDHFGVRGRFRLSTENGRLRTLERVG